MLTKQAEEKTETNEPKVNIYVKLSKVLKRDFKIHGVIAGDNFKDGLSFVSLSRQIDAGLKAGYKENEIIDAVIRAVSPSLQLRSYLEMIQDLTLTRLRLVMKAHFKQKSGTELYQELSNLRQETSETPQDFLVRAMTLRQQIIFVSSASDSPVKYEPSLVQSLFLHVLETGLQDEAVRAKLRPFLEKTRRDFFEQKAAKSPAQFNCQRLTPTRLLKLRKNGRCKWRIFQYSSRRSGHR